MIDTQIGPYKILQEIGRGGMATVYRAYQSTVERDVAIKVILKRIAADESSSQRFQREARLIARLEHPHILPVYDFDGRHDPPYIVMRYIDSGTLKDVIRHGRLPVDEIMHLMNQVASALDYAHRQGIVHRDIKPSNVMIDREGNAFLADLGIARIRDAGAGAITQTGDIVGTPDYMAPEQAMGSLEVDHRADIYGLGVIFFQMITGELPYIAPTPMATAVMHINDAVPLASHRNDRLPEAFDKVMLKVMAKEPDDRYASALEFVAAAGQSLGNVDPGITTSLRLAVKSATQEMEVRTEAQTVTDTQSTPSEQNRTVTAMSINVAEFAEIIDEDKGAVAAREAVQAYWQDCFKFIKVYGGRIMNEGDTDLLAVWGAEQSREDDPERALRAALALMDTMRSHFQPYLVDDEDEPLPINIGVNTGLALLTPDQHDTSSLSISGGTISVTSRLSNHADGKLLITHDTYRYVRGLFFIAPEQPLKLRGRRGQLEVYEVTSAKLVATKQAVRGVEGVETALIGRLAELDTLQKAFFTATEDQEISAVTILGAAGLGKSRLFQEFSDWVELRPEVIRVFRARATANMRPRPYALLRDMFSLSFSITEGDSLDLVRQKITEGVERITGQRDEDLADLLMYLAGYDPDREVADVQDMNQRARRGIVRYIRQAAVAHDIEAVRIEIEDIHHADDASLDLFNDVLDASQDVALIFFASARPELLERRPDWGSGQNYHTVLELQPLDKRDSRDLVREILQKLEDIPKSLRDLLVDRAEGNPYYMEELVKMLVEDHIILKDTEVWTVEESRLENLAVPPTLYGLMQSRVDSLLYPERTALERGAVFGRVFYDAAVAKMGPEILDLKAVLDKLVEREFVHRREKSGFTDAVEYSFAQNMLRDMIVETMLPHQREAYSLQAALWLEDAAGERIDEYTGLIADYYEQAGEDEKAIDLLIQAGDRANLRGTYRDAVAIYDRAWSLLPNNSVQRRLGLLVRRAEGQRHLGQLDLAQATAQEALELAQAKDDKDHAVRALLVMVAVSNARGDREGSKTLLDKAMRLGESASDPAQMCAVLVELVGHYNQTGEFDESRKYADLALAYANEHNLAYQHLRIVNMMGIIAGLSGDLDEAERQFQHLRDLSLEHEDKRRLRTALANLGEVARIRKDFAKARTYIEESLAHVEASGDLAGKLVDLQNLANVMISLEDLDAALKHINRALKEAVEAGAVEHQIPSIITSARLITHQGDAKRGVTLLGLAGSHPAAAAQDRQEIERVLDEIRESFGLSAKEIKTAIAAGEKLDFKDTLTELLAQPAQKA